MVAAMKVSRTTVVDVPGLGERIKRARKADPRSLVQICGLIDITPANWYKIEAEETKVLPIETLRRIEDVLGVDFGVSFEG